MRSLNLYAATSIRLEQKSIHIIVWIFLIQMRAVKNIITVDTIIRVPGLHVDEINSSGLNAMKEIIKAATKSI